MSKTPNGSDRIKNINKDWEKEIIRLSRAYHTGICNIIMHPSGNYSAKAKALKNLDKSHIEHIKELEYSRDETISGGNQLIKEKPF